MRVAEEHSRISMPTEQSHLRNAQPNLKEPANGFMAKVMKMEIRYPGSRSESVPRQSEGIPRKRKNTAGNVGYIVEDCCRHLGHRQYARVAILTVLNEKSTSRPVNMFPTQS
jgi:hypothetical protein